MLALPAEFATPSDTLGAVQRLSFYDLPFDWYAGYQQRLKAVDTKAVRAAAEKHLRAQDFVVLVVGDASKVLKDLDAIAAEKVFGGGGLVVLDATTGALLLERHHLGLTVQRLPDAKPPAR